ncbi:MAG: methyltransferase domain-containing protein [Mesorhizobium sp.]|nr:methyltransferase domain-containing protein [Mesorhizobium sp.]
MQKVSLSSGDPIADRRADYAAMLAEAGDDRAAAELMREALSLAPAWAPGWYRLGEMLEQVGERPEAARAWRETLRLDPADRLGAALRLQLSGEPVALDAAPSAFVAALFDQYAHKFDRELLEKLDYRVPASIAGVLAAAGRDRFAHVVDLGCGTGLMGERLRGMASFIEGHDLSEGMLGRARAKGVYDQLERSDLSAFAPGTARADLVTAADVFIYLGRLERVFEAALSMLVADGLFAFSVERHDGEGDFVLRESRRYAHSPAYIRATLRAAGFDVVQLNEEVLRFDRGEPVQGMVVLAVRRGAEDRLGAVTDPSAAEWRLAR